MTSIVTPHRPLFGPHQITALNDTAAPPFPGREADDEEDAAEAGKDLDVECQRARWSGLPPAEPPADAPVRFIDGSIASRTVGWLAVGGRRRPLIAATISAAALEFDAGKLRRGAGARTLKVLCLYSNGIDREYLIAADRVLQALGVRLIASDAEVAHADFDSLRRATRGIAMAAMEESERDVMLVDTTVPTLMDGLIERRLKAQAHAVPVCGLVKRQMRTYLPPGLQEVVYSLRPGERTPAFVLRTEHVDLVNIYVRLSAERGASPSYGIVRVTVPLAYVDAAHRGSRMVPYFSGLAGYLYRLRHRDLAYERAGISVEPIVRVEDHLKAIRPDLESLIPKLHRLFEKGAA